MTTIELMILLFSIVSFSIFLCIFLYMAWDRYVRQVKYIRAIMLMKDGGYKLLWLKKTGRMEKKYHIASNKSHGFFQYLDSDVVKIGRYNGLYVKEDSAHALSIDIKNTVFLDKTTVNADSMKEILESKLIAELVEPKLRIADIVLIVGILILVAGIIALYVKMGNISESNALLMQKLDELTKLIADQSTQVIRPIK